ncbi:MAG: nitroreductase family protein [Egibacteraceae bacterium]
MSTTLALSPDQLLTTTRSVRRRLDLTRPVGREVIEECLSIAQQAPTVSNMQSVHFVIVTDPAKRAALAEVWRRGADVYKDLPAAVEKLKFEDPRQQESAPRIAASGAYLADHLHEVPVHVIPCFYGGRADGEHVAAQSGVWGSIVPAVWSFMLAARLRGLGTCYTSVHLFYEKEAASILNIPYEEVMQAALVPVAYSKGTEFKPAYRVPLENILHWDSW